MLLQGARFSRHTDSMATALAPSDAPDAPMRPMRRPAQPARQPAVPHGHRGHAGLLHRRRDQPADPPSLHHRRARRVQPGRGCCRRGLQRGRHRRPALDRVDGPALRRAVDDDRRRTAGHRCRGAHAAAHTDRAAPGPAHAPRRGRGHCTSSARPRSSTTSHRARRRAEAASYFSVAVFGGLGIGPVLGELLASGGHYTQAFLLAAMFTMVAAAISRTLPATVGAPPVVVADAAPMPAPAPGRAPHGHRAGHGHAGLHGLHGLPAVAGRGGRRRQRRRHLPALQRPRPAAAPVRGPCARADRLGLLGGVGPRAPSAPG